MKDRKVMKDMKENGVFLLKRFRIFHSFHFFHIFKIISSLVLKPPPTL